MDQAEIRAFRERFRRLRRMVSGELEERICKLDITVAQCDVLLAMENRDTSTIVELADVLGLDKSTISRTVDALVERGYMSRETDPDDRRYNRLALTESGRSHCDAINELGDKWTAVILSHLEPDQRRIAVKGFNLIVDLLQTEEDPNKEECCETGGDQ